MIRADLRDLASLFSHCSSTSLFGSVPRQLRIHIDKDTTGELDIRKKQCESRTIGSWSTCPKIHVTMAIVGMRIKE